jgi:protein-L-isoaspartate(D-aspartate) O-methyltransferase
MGCRAYGIELEAGLCEASRRTLSDMGAAPVQVRCGDGFAGWPEEAPFDAVILSCAVPEIPEPLWRQLKVGGRLVAPVGTGNQELVLLRKTARGREERRISAVRFVPMRRLPPPR